MKTSTLDALESGTCRTADRDLWFSEKREDRIQAAALCLACPALTACRDFLEDTGGNPGWGVFAGIDFHPIQKFRVKPQAHHVETCETCTDVVEAAASGIQPRAIAGHLGRSYGSISGHLSYFKIYSLKPLIAPPEGYWK